MKNVILPAQVLAAAQLCQAKNGIRYYLCGIFINDKTIASTNGRYLFRNDYTESFKSHIESYSESEKMEGSVIISIDSAVPKCAWTAHLYSIDDKKGYIEYRKGNTDICGRAFFDVIDGVYPDIDRVMPKGEPQPITSVGLNQDYISICGKVFQKFDKFAGAEMIFYGKDSAVKISKQTRDNGEVLMIIIPCRL